MNKNPKSCNNFASFFSTSNKYKAALDCVKNDINSLKAAVFTLFPTLSGNESIRFKATAKGAICTEFGTSELGLINGGKGFNLDQLLFYKYGKGNFAAKIEFLEGLGAFVNAPLQPNSAKPKQAQQSTVKAPVKPKLELIQDGANSAYLTQKTGADLALLRRANVQEKEGLRAVFFRSKNYTKEKRYQAKPNEPKYKQYQENEFVIFGSNCLDTAKDALIFCEGETDCLALLAAGFNAVTLGSIADYQSQTDDQKEAVLSVCAGFKTVFVWLDITKQTKRDKVNAQVIAQNFADKYGFVWVDFGFLAHYTGINLEPEKDFDICDLYKRLGKDSFALAVECALEQNGRLGENPKDELSYGINHCLNINFSQYLSEKKDGQKIGTAVLDIAEMQSYYKKVALSSVAGTGKTALFKVLATQVWANEKVIICFPTNAILGQFANDLDGSNIRYGRLEKGLATKGDDLANELSERIIICTYDSSKYVSKLPDFENAFFIIDEFHQIAQDSSYRLDACQAVLALIEKAKNVMLASATPELLFCSNALPSLNYKLIRCKEQIKNSIEISIYTTPKGFGAVDYFDTIEGLLNPKAGALLQVQNSKKNNTYLANQLTERGLKCADISADNKEDSTVYKSIMETGLANVDALFSTCLIEAGVSIKSPISLVSIVDFYHASKITQVATRARMNGNFNKLVKCAVFLKERKTTAPKQNSLEYFNTLIADARKEANKSKKYKAKTDLDKFISKDGEINLTQVLRAVFEYEEKSSTAEMIKARLEFLDDRFKVTIFDAVLADKNLEFAEIAALQKAEKEALKEQTKTAALANFDLFALATIGASKKDSEAKAELKAALALPIVPKADIKAYYNENKSLINPLGMNYLTKVSNLMGLGLSKADATVKAKDVTKTKIEKAQALKVHQSRMSENVTGLRDEKEAAKIEAVKSVLQQRAKDAKRGRAKEFLSPSELATIANKALEKEGAQKAALKSAKNIIPYLSTFFDFETKRTKTGTLYKIAATKTKIEL